MKVLSTDGLTKLIELIKGAFISVDNTVSTSLVTLATVATSGSYNDLSDKPTIPTVNNATLTIQKNGTTVNTFTANASSNVTANITVPTSTTQLTNDSGFITGITSSDVTTALGYTPADTYSTTNPALTSSNSICTWAVTHNLGDNVEVQVYNSSDKKVLADVTLTSSTVATVELFSTSNISAGAYKVVVIGK